MTPDRLDVPPTRLRPPSDYRLPAEASDALGSRMRRVHERVAQMTERRTPTAVAELAMHYDHGGSRDKAYQYALMAADLACTSYAHHDALDLLGIAERNASMDSALADVRIRMAEVLEALGRFQEGEALCTAALEWMLAHADPRRTIAPRRIRERIRSFLGQPARQTLGACTALDEEARSRGSEAERVALHVMISQAHSRLGERALAEKMAGAGVSLAERLGNSGLIADSLVRFGITRDPVDSDEARLVFRRALGLYEGIGDLRGQARCHNNLGISHQLRGEWSEAQAELERAISAARGAGMREIWGLAALNSGVMALKRGDHERAGDRFGESLAIFSAMHDTERQLYAVYNLAHLERERPEHDAAMELYDVACAMARSIGLSDVEIGARAGYGLALLEQGKDVAARVASLEAAERMRERAEWFQGRELAEGLRIRMMVLDGKTAEARQRLVDAITLAGPADTYGACWLVAHCASVLVTTHAEEMRELAARHATIAQSGAYTQLLGKLEAVSAS